MGWIGMTDRHLGLFNAAGIGASKARTDEGARAKHEILPTGTLVAEVKFAAEPGEAQDVLVYGRVKDWHRHLSLRLSGDGVLTLTLIQGPETVTASLKLTLPGRDTKMRVYYSWNGPKRQGRLAVENAATGLFQLTQVANPLPMPLLDAQTIMRNGAATDIGAETHFIAISNEVEPIGMANGVCAGTPVETLTGSVPVERLRLGDYVVTAGSGPQPIRWITRRTVPALGGFAPLRLRAPYFGLERDLIVASSHRISVSGADTEYMLGQDDVLLEAGRLLGSHAVDPVQTGRLVTYYQVLLDQHECLLHDSLWSESLYVGQIAMDPDRCAASGLADMPPSAVPVHRAMAKTRLSEIEARSLASVLHR